MSVQAIQAHSLTLVPPLDMPLSLRMEHGRFASLRPESIPEPPCTQNSILPDDPDPTDIPDHIRFHLHYAIDLNASPGDCVYAAYSGRVVEVENSGNQGHIIIDHHPAGFGYATKYIHISDIRVNVGDTVQQGQPIAAVADVQRIAPHLHFSLWLVVDQGILNKWDDTLNEMVPIDPTRWLYRWEREFLDEAELFGGPKVPQKIAVVQSNRMPFFQVVFDSPLEVANEDGDPVSPGSAIIPPIPIPVPYYIPLYEPVDVDERLMVDMLRDAFLNQREVLIYYRHSAFFERQIISQVIVT